MIPTTINTPAQRLHGLTFSSAISYGNKIYRDFILNHADQLRADPGQCAQLCSVLHAGVVLAQHKDPVVVEQAFHWIDVAFLLYPDVARHFETCATLADPCSPDFWKLIAQCNQQAPALGLPDSIGKQA